MVNTELRTAHENFGFIFIFIFINTKKKRSINAWGENDVLFYSQKTGLVLRRRANLGTIVWSAVFSVKDFLGAIHTQEFENDLLFIHTSKKRDTEKHTYIHFWAIL